MSDDALVAVIVPDRESRDLICLNLRFESINTIAYESLENYLDSDCESSLAVIDITGEIDKSHLERLKNISSHIYLTADSSGDDCEIIVEPINNRIRFDAADLVSKVKELLESNRDEPTRHPLTGVPAGSVVEKHIVGHLASGKNFSLIASDMDNMKAFNQRFGYAKGDELLKNFVNLMESVLAEFKNDLNFIGHRGEDDFVIVTSADLAVSIAEKIVDGFDEMVRGYFSDDDLERGFFLVSDSKGGEIKFPLTTVSLVIINTEHKYFSHPAELYDGAEVMMSQVKARGIQQSYCAVDENNKVISPRDVFI